MRFLLSCCLLASLTGCKLNEETKVKAIIGAVLIDGNGGPPITDSVVVISGSRIRAAGLRANVPIPAGSDKINGSRSEEHTSELQSQSNLVCRLLLEKKKRSGLAVCLSYINRRVAIRLL